MTSPHEILNPPTLAEPAGFSHAVVAAEGRTMYLGGQAAHDANSTIVGGSMAEQFAQAAANVVAALQAAGAEPEHLVSMQIFVTDATEYRQSLSELSVAYRTHFGRHYPAIALMEVEGLFDPAAKVELVCVAVVPSDTAP
ncbi:MAG TPA: RidA family protein [Actinomycetota bacterium]|nr:RidA family protein [Actinomycetota bacterium]